MTDPGVPDRPRNQPEDRVVYLPVKVTFEGLADPTNGPYFKGLVQMSPAHQPTTYSISESQVVNELPFVRALARADAEIADLRQIIRDEAGWPEHLRSDAPSQVCGRCGRSTWSKSEFGAECRMTQPDGYPCGGSFHEPLGVGGQ